MTLCPGCLLRQLIEDRTYSRKCPLCVLFSLKLGLVVSSFKLVVVHHDRIRKNVLWVICKNSPVEEVK